MKTKKKNENVEGFRKGQLTPTSLVIFVSAFIIVILMIPVINSITDSALGPVINNSTPNGQLLMSVISLVPAVLLFGVIAAMISAAVPKPAQRGGY